MKTATTMLLLCLIISTANADEGTTITITRIAHRDPNWNPVAKEMPIGTRWEDVHGNVWTRSSHHWFIDWVPDNLSGLQGLKWGDATAEKYCVGPVRDAKHTTAYFLIQRSGEKQPKPWDQTRAFLAEVLGAESDTPWTLEKTDNGWRAAFTYERSKRQTNPVEKIVIIGEQEPTIHFTFHKQSERNERIRLWGILRTHIRDGMRYHRGGFEGPFREEKNWTWRVSVLRRKKG